MTRLLGIAKRLLVPVLLAGALLGVQAVVALPPNPGFEFSPQQPLACQPVTFTSNAVDPEDDPMTIEWDFDYDGLNFDSQDTGSSVVHEYGTPGSRMVAQRVSDGIDPALPPAVQSVAVGVNPPPTASISPAFRNVQAGQLVSFAASSPDPAIESYAWDFDYDGVTFNTDSTANPASHAFPVVGDGQIVALRVTDDCGAVSPIAEAQVNVLNTPPTITSLDIDTNPVNPGGTVTFTATASDANNDTLTYEWSLDGDSVYNEPGEVGEVNSAVTSKPYPVVRAPLTIRLRVSDGRGGVATTTDTLTINRPPTARFSISREAPLIGEQVTFDPSESDDLDGPITTYEWDLDGDGDYETLRTAAAPAPDPVAYNTTDPVSVGLKVTDADGGFDEEHRTVTPQLSRPTAALRFSPAAPLPGQRVTLTSASAPAAIPIAQQLVTTQWDFSYQPTADFQVDAAGPSASTSFATPGPKTVAVKVFQTGGGVDIAFLTIVVNAPPLASFEIAPDAPIEGDRLRLASTSADPDGPLAKQEWDLDADGQYDDATGALVSQPNAKKGLHTVRLRVTDSRGAIAVKEQSLTVAPKPLKQLPEVGKTFYFTPAKWGMKLTRLVVKVPSRTTVRLKCKGRGCPKGTFKKRSKKARARLRFDKFKGSLRAGAKIMVISTRPGYMGQHVTYTVRGNFRQPSKRERCFRGSPKRLRACPTS